MARKVAEARAVVTALAGRTAPVRCVDIRMRALQTLRPCGKCKSGLSAEKTLAPGRSSQILRAGSSAKGERGTQTPHLYPNASRRRSRKRLTPLTAAAPHSLPAARRRVRRLRAGFRELSRLRDRRALARRPSRDCGTWAGRRGRAQGHGPGASEGAKAMARGARARSASERIITAGAVLQRWGKWALKGDRPYCVAGAG